MIWILFGLIILFVVLQAADVATTYNGLNKGANERNPMTRDLIARWGLLPGLLLTKLVIMAPLAIVLLGLYWFFPAALTSVELLAFLGAADAAFICVVVNNLWQIVQRIKAERAERVV